MVLFPTFPDGVFSAVQERNVLKLLLTVSDEENADIPSHEDKTSIEAGSGRTVGRRVHGRSCVCTATHVSPFASGSERAASRYVKCCPLLISHV